MKKNKGINKVSLILLISGVSLLAMFLVLLIFNQKINFTYTPYSAENISLVFDDQIQDSQRLDDLDFLLSDVRKMSDAGTKAVVVDYNLINQEKNILSLIPMVNNFYINIFSRKDLDLDNTAIFNNRFNIDSLFEVRSYLTEQNQLKIFYYSADKKVSFLFPGQNLNINEETLKLNDFVVYSLENMNSDVLLKIGETIVDLSNYENNVTISAQDLLENKIIIYQREDLNLLSSQNYSFEQGFWSQEVGDCSAYLDDEAILSMDLVNDAKSGAKSLELSSENHFACTFSNFSLNLQNNKLYKLSVAYKSLAGDEVQYYYNLSNDEGQHQEKVKKIIPKKDQWAYTSTIIVPEIDNINNIDVYLYAPSDGSSKITNLYDDITLSSYIAKNEIKVDEFILPKHYGLSNWLFLEKGKNIFQYPNNKKNLLDDFNYSFETRTWTSDVEDCSNYLGGESKMEMRLVQDSQDGNKSLELVSDNHFACTFETFPIDLESDKFYKLTFAYRNLEGGKMQYYYNLRNESENQDFYDIIETQDNEWKNFRAIIDPKINEISDLDIYLYAPSDGSERVVNRYDNIRLEEFAPKEIYSYYLYSQNQKISEGSKVQNIYFKQINKYETKVVLHHAQDSLLLVYPDKYSIGWRLYTTTNDDVIKESLDNVSENNSLSDPSFWSTFFLTPLDNNYHFQINNYNNGWLLDVKNLCLDGETCQKNEDGTYDITLIIENRLNKIFKFGLLVSIVITIIGALLLKVTKND